MNPRSSDLASIRGRRRAWHARGRSFPAALRDRGIAAIETLLAAPIVLLLGLSALQWGLVFHGRQAVAHAAIEGARAGSVDHASDEAIERGLARGLSPWLFGASGPGDHQANLQRAAGHLRFGTRAGWVDWRRLAPTRESFVDWAEPARDAAGQPVPGVLEIPNDNLALRIGDRQPASGVAGYRGRAPIGTASSQTLADANLLKIEFIYGVPLTVPLVGRLGAWVMRALDDCASEAVAPMRLGTVDLGRPEPQRNPRRWACAHYDAVDEQGTPRPRWPVRVSATVRMQSPARDRDAAPARDGAPNPGPSLGPGEVDGAASFVMPRLEDVNPNGAGPGADGSVDRSSGFLRMGGDRLVPLPAGCGST